MYIYQNQGKMARRKIVVDRRTGGGNSYFQQCTGWTDPENTTVLSVRRILLFRSPNFFRYVEHSLDGIASCRFQFTTSILQSMEFIGYHERSQDGYAMGVDRARPFFHFFHLFIDIECQFADVGGIVSSLEAVDLTVYFDLDGFHLFPHHQGTPCIRGVAHPALALAHS